MLMSNPPTSHKIIKMKIFKSHLALLVLTFMWLNDVAQNLPSIDKETGFFYLGMNKFESTPLIFGYSSPDKKSKKLICFSSFTKDVENNPYKCALGAYYESDSLSIQFLSFSGNFALMELQHEGSKSDYFFVEKKNIRFD